MQIKNRQQFLTILTLTAVGLLAVDRIISPPLTKLWKDRQAQIAKLKKDVNEGNLLHRRKDLLHKRWADIQAAALPNDPTAAEQQLFNGLNRWAQFSGITIMNIAPSWKQANDPAYRTLECQVDAAGGLVPLSQFLYAMETDPMALKMQSIEMTSKDANGTVINMGVRMSALVLTGAETKK
ncbi:MAG TPA: hypothetical protein VHC44_07195 [Verrucomicrobiae bacterium]|nr:hypothetical protein [Verrucomicrobiae bacterium]